MKITHSDVQMTASLDTRTMLREINTRLRELARVVNANSEQLEPDAWDDLRVPVTGLNPTGQGAPPTVDTATSGTLLFNKAGLNQVGFVVQMPHDWLEGSDIYPHVHWAKTDGGDTGDVRWGLYVKHSAIGGVMDASSTTYFVDDVVVSTPDDGTTERHLISAFGPIDMSGKTISHMLVCTLARLGYHANDTYDADARLLEIDFHYQRDSFGSSQEFIK